MRRLLSQIALYGGLGLAVFGAAYAGLPKGLVIAAAMVVFVPLSLWIDREVPPHVPSPSEAGQRELWKTIGLLAISLLFCATAIMVLGKNWRLSVVTLALFGGASIVFVDILRRRLRERRLRSLGIENVRIIGGVDIPMAHGRIVATGLALTAAGLIAYALGVQFPWLFRILGLLMAALGLGLLAALPFMGRRRIRFDPHGLLIGELRYEYRVPWDDIHETGILEHASNPFVTLQLRDAGHIAVDPPSRRGAFLRGVNSTRAWYGADVALLAHLFGLQASLLAAAISRYAGDPSSRGELADRLLEKQT